MSHPAPPKTLHEKLKRTLAEQLESDEHILWSAAPLPGQAAGRKIYFALGGLLCCSLAVSAWYFDSNVRGPQGTLSGKLIWLWIFVLGIVWLASPFRAAWKARRAYYAITTRRAFIIMLGRRLSIQSFKTFRLGHVETLLDPASGGGDLMFGRALQYAPGGPRYEREVGFYNLQDVRAAVAALKSSHGRPAYSGAMQPGEH